MFFHMITYMFFLDIVLYIRTRYFVLATPVLNRVWSPFQLSELSSVVVKTS